MSVTIYHNPRCSKSRQTLALLEEKGVHPAVVEYLDTPPEAGELKRILGLLGMTPRDLRRKKEAREAGLDDPGLSDDEIIAGMVANPLVIERPLVIEGPLAIDRPIVVRGDLSSPAAAAALGRSRARSAESVLEIL